MPLADKFIFLQIEKRQTMRVLIVNTSENAGGAAVAAGRLVDALNNNGVKAKMLVRDKQTDDITVAQLPRTAFAKWHFMWERWCVFWHLHFSRKHLFELDIANAGTDITRLPEYKEADIIHLHWVNQGMLSLSCIRKILKDKKPVVWTMHDMWPATSICHLTLGCNKFSSGCQHCKYLPGKGSKNDISARVWRRKMRTYREGSMLMVACSKWLCSQAKKSGLLAGQRVVSIPNPIDTRIFRPIDKEEARQRAMLPAKGRIILFIAQRATNPNKGMTYLIEACKKMAADHPETLDDTAVAILGGHAEDFADSLPFPVYPLGYVSDERKIVDVYNSADLFVLPSLSENLPNTIMEAMACGVPCVGFRVGGIPEMIDHQRNGYVAEYKSVDDLSRGLYWVMQEADRRSLGEEAVKKVAASYSQYSVAMKYIEAYNQAMALKRYKL